MKRLRLASDVGEERRGPAASAKTIQGEPPVTRVARTLALAHYVERQIDAGGVESYAEAARSLGSTRARLTQVMNLLLLAPEIQQGIVSGEVACSERQLRGAVAESSWKRQLRRVSGNGHLSSDTPEERK